MKIYTKKGDSGETSLLRGGRVPKHHPRVEAYGTMDELNSWFGYVRSINNNEKMESYLKELQNYIFVASSDVAAPLEKSKADSKIPRVEENWITRIEEIIDNLEAELPPLKTFILPGGTASAGALHIARTVCRRAERRLTELVEIEGDVNPLAIKFVNRMSDLIFVLSRWANFIEGIDDIPWISSK